MGQRQPGALNAGCALVGSIWFGARWIPCARHILNLLIRQDVRIEHFVTTRNLTLDDQETRGTARWLIA